MRTVDWNKIYEEQAPVLKGVSRRYVKDCSIAEDIVHNAFEIAIAKIDSYDGRGSFEGWLKKIVINHSLQYLRDAQRQNIQQENYRLLIDTDNRMKDVDEHKVAFSCNELLNVIDELPEQYKLVFNLYVLDGYKHREIAEMLHITTGTSKANLARARQKAQYILEQKYPDRAKYVRDSWILLLLLPGKRIDRVFSKGLSGYQLEIVKKIISDTSVFSKVPVAKAIICKCIVGVTILVISATSIFLFTQKVPSSSADIVPITSIIDTIQNTETEIADTNSTKIIEKVKIDTILPETPPKEPIVIIKKVIVRDTVLVER